LRCLDEQKFHNYWFETGTPTFLVNLLKEKGYYLPRMEGLEIKETDFSSYEIEHLNVNSLLFQTGYITIKEIVDEEERIYLLGYPNLEVKKSFIEVLFCEYTEREETIIFEEIRERLRCGEIEGFMEIICSLYGGLSYPVSGGMREADFQSLFYLMVSGAGVWTQTEVLTSEGRIDIVIELKERIYIIEFKCNQTAERAIEQIKERRYYERYLSQGKEIYLLGINFSTERRNIADWKMEKVKSVS